MNAVQAYQAGSALRDSQCRPHQTQVAKRTLMALAREHLAHRPVAGQEQ